MNILYITQYFHPEIGATTNRALANVRYLSKKNHDVTVLTEMPNHPKGIIFEGYKSKLFMTEEMEDFSIKRVWVFTSVKKNFVTRLLFYISFAFLGSFSAILSWKSYDIVYVTSPPLFVGIIGLTLKFFFPKAKFVFEVRDLWPDAAIEMGELKNNYFREDKISDYMSLADCGILPYFEATQSGLPYIFYSFSKPLIISSVGDLPEQCNEDIAIVSEPNSKDFVQAIIMMMKNNGKAKESHFKDFLIKYNWDKTIEKYKKVYDRDLGDNI